MATYSQIGEVSRNENFQRRVAYALTKAAVDVYAEAGTTAGHTERALYATKVLNSAYNLPGAIYGVLANTTIAAAANPATQPDNGIADSDIQTAVNSIFSALAGAPLS